MANYFLYFESLNVLDAPKDAGKHMELYFKLNVDNGAKVLQIPSSGTHSMPLKPGTWEIDTCVQFTNNVSVTLMESDSSSSDDNYGTVVIPNTPTNGDKVASFGKKDDCAFDLNYMVK